jgi:hypothetical protein
MSKVCVVFNATPGDRPDNVVGVFSALSSAEEFAANKSIGKKYHAYLLPQLDVDYFSLCEKDLENIACVPLCGIRCNKLPHTAR